MDMHCADDSVANDAECGMVVMNPCLSLVKKRKFLSLNNFVFFSDWFGVEEYSHDLMAKNNAPHSSWPIAVLSGLDWSCHIDFQTINGRHDWCFVGGSRFLYPFIWFVRMVDLVPELSRVGSARRFFLKV